VTEGSSLILQLCGVCVDFVTRRKVWKQDSQFVKP